MVCMVLSFGTNLSSLCTPSAFVQSSFSNKDLGGISSTPASLPPSPPGLAAPGSRWAKPAPAPMVCTKCRILPSSPHPKEFGIAIAERGSPSARGRASEILMDGQAGNLDKM